MNKAVTVTTSMMVTGASVYAGTIAQGKRPRIQPAVGIALAGTILLVAAGSRRYGTTAARLSVLIATTAAVTSGFYAANALASYFRSAPQAVTVVPSSTGASGPFVPTTTGTGGDGGGGFGAR